MTSSDSASTASTSSFATLQWLQESLQAAPNAMSASLLNLNSLVSAYEEIPRDDGSQARFRQAFQIPTGEAGRQLKEQINFNRMSEPLQKSPSSKAPAALPQPSGATSSTWLSPNTSHRATHEVPALSRSYSSRAYSPRPSYPPIFSKVPTLSQYGSVSPYPHYNRYNLRAVGLEDSHHQRADQGEVSKVKNSKEAEASNDPRCNRRIRSLVSNQLL